MVTGRVMYPIPVSGFRGIGGFVGRRMAANVDRYLKIFDIDAYVGMVEQKTHRDWWWIGEQPGKWLESAALNAWMGDKALATKTEEVLARIAGAQEPSGYVGITDPAVRTAERPLRGMEAYELYFLLHALCTVHEVRQDASALETARRLGDYLVDTIGPGKAAFWPSDLRPPENEGTYVGGESRIAGHGVHYSLEGTLLIDPMLRLYAQTGEERYRVWAKWAIDHIDVWSGWKTFSRLDEVAAGGLGIDAVQPYVHSHTFHMNFLGFLRMYEVTGDESYLNKVAGAWRDIAERQMYITGGVSVGEHYEKGYTKPLTGNVVETCATMSWMEVTQYLLELTGDPRYADVIERLIFNHVFAAQTIDGDCFRYHTPPNGTKHDYFHGPDCCTASGHRMVSKLPVFFYAQDDRGVFINQYVPSEAHISLEGGATLDVHQETRYPEEETILIRVGASVPVNALMRLRIPGWCGKPSVALNGVPLSDVCPGTYLPIARVWQAGDILRLMFPMKVRWERRAHHTKDRLVRLQGGGGEEMRESVPDEDAPYALVRGPVVYAFDTAWQADTVTVAASDVAVDMASVSVLEEVPTPDRAMGPAIIADLATVDRETARVIMLPFANIGRWYRDPRNKPDRHSKGISYATWLPEANGPEWQRRVAMNREQRELLAKAIDCIEIGNPDAEAAHHVSGGVADVRAGRPCRRVAAAESLECTLTVSSIGPSAMMVFYEGRAIAEAFEVIVNERRVFPQGFNEDAAGLCEVVYAIPFELVQGKTDQYGQPVNTVQVTFSLSGGSVARAIFGVATLPGEEGPQ